MDDLIPPYDFTEAISLSLDERFRRCIDRARELHQLWGLEEDDIVPPVPADGASDEVIGNWEQTYGERLPTEYRQFLSRCRHLLLSDGFRIYGFGDRVRSPWISDEHRRGFTFLVIGEYWGYADGDQLMINMNVPEHPVVSYLHEENGATVDYAPSFSLALWRLVHEL
jgi:hypothetical protein